MTENKFQKFMYNLPIVKDSTRIRTKVLIGDITVSIQASDQHYSDPQERGLRKYRQWEVGFPSQAIEEFIPYETPIGSYDYTKMVYAYVPTEAILAVISRLGGIKEVPVDHETP